MTRFIFFLWTCFLLASCQNRASDAVRERAIKNYMIIHAAYVVTKPGQQLFIDRLTESVLQLKDNNGLAIDTKQLRSMLDTAKQESETKLSIIRLAEEPDAEIRFKQKALSYAELINAAFKEEFKGVIEVLESNNSNRYETASLFVLPKLKQIKEAELLYKEADENMRKRYDIEITEIPEADPNQ